MSLIIGVAVAAVVVLCCIAYLIYRFVLDPHNNEKSDYPVNYHAGQQDHYVGKGPSHPVHNYDYK